MITSKSMRIISIMNYKGGTGKTSTTVNLAHGLTLSGKRVLIIDLDPQGSVGYYLGLSPKKTIYDLLVKKALFTSCITDARAGLDVICANEHLYPAELHMATLPKKESILADRLSQISGYDYILIDCAPSLNLLNQNALYYSNEILLPVSMEYLSLVGVKQLLKNIQIMNRMFDQDVKITKVVPTFFDKRQAKSRHVLDSLSRVFPGRVSSPIHANVALSEAPGHRKSIFEYDPNSKGAKDYLKLTREVIAND